MDKSHNHARVIIRRLGACVLLLVASACGSDPEDANGDGVVDGVLEPNNVSVITPTRPRGFVAGRVVDATTQAVISGATVTLFGAGLSAETTTNDTGGFQFGPIAAGAAFSLQISAEGFIVADLPARQIDDAAGNFPTDNAGLFVGPIGLLPDTGTFQVQVIAESGGLIQGAQVTVESAVAYFEGETARRSVVASGVTNADGTANVSGLPNVRALPPRRANAAALVINVAPVDVDGDGSLDLAGQVVNLSGETVQTSAQPPIVVLPAASGDQPLEVVASNVAGLIGASRNATPSVLQPEEPLRIVFNQPVDEASFLVVITDEAGENQLPTNINLGALGNVVEILHDTSFQIGQEQNVRIRAQSASAASGGMLSRTAAFFAAGDPSAPIRAMGMFIDNNRDNRWGNDGDRMEIMLDTPVGRAGQNPGFVAQLYVDLDLNGTSTVGDARGELPAFGRAYPAPIIVNAAEPVPRDGGVRSGYTRFLSAVGVNLPMSIEVTDGPIDFEVRFAASDNGGAFITDPGGRSAPPRLTGSAQLIQR